MTYSLLVCHCQMLIQELRGDNLLAVPVNKSITLKSLGKCCQSQTHRSASSHRQWKSFRLESVLKYHLLEAGYFNVVWAFFNVYLAIPLIPTLLQFILISKAPKNLLLNHFDDSLLESAMWFCRHKSCILWQKFTEMALSVYSVDDFL